MPTQIYGILVEADGYLPDLSQSAEAKAGNQYLEISLVRGNGLSGVVLLPNGSPADNASVFLCGGSTNQSNLPSGVSVSVGGPMMMDNIKAIQCSGSRIGGPFAAAAETDSSGRFSLKAVPQAHSFYAAHEKGFAAIVPENIPASGRITLQPWGRITGVLMVGLKPGANQSLSSMASPSSTELRVMLRATADSDGRFEFASVPPGEYRIRAAGGQIADAIARSGETALVGIGGTGRPLVGRIVSGSDRNAGSIQTVGLSLKLPDENIPKPTDADYREWMQSEAYLARMRLQRSYTIRLEPDGSFRLEDVPAGTYTLTAIMPRPPASQPGVFSAPERFTKEIVVPEMPGGRSDDPLNLGVINVQVPAKK